MSPSKITPASILAGHAPYVRRLANRLRSIITETLPEAEERAYPVWHGVGYRHPQAGYVCGVFPLEDRVKIYFEQGKFLDDPAGLFTGTGKQTGQIEFRKLADIRIRPLQQLLHESVEFGIRKRKMKR